MARISYGGDLFSPLKEEKPKPSEYGRDSDMFFQQLKALAKENNKDKKKGIPEETSVTPKKSRNGNVSPIVKSNKKLFCEKSSTGDIGKSSSIKNKSSTITVRKKSSIQNQNILDENELNFQTSDKNSMLSLNNKKNSSQVHVTVRSENSKKKESKANIISQSRSCSKLTLPSLAEVEFKKPILSKTVSKDNVKSKCEITKSKLINENVINKTRNKPNAVINNPTQVSNSSSQNKSDNAMLLEENESDSSDAKNILNEGLHKSSIDETAMFNSASKTNQIQANIIEKLVKDAVSFEFDGIRQMLYLQQLSLIKHMDKNFIANRENSANVEVLVGIIESLMEENRKLKDIIARQNF